MTTTKRAVLRELVEQFETACQPLPPEKLASLVDTHCTEVTAALESLEDLHLVAIVDDGYRPTVTAFELVERDLLDQGLLVIDVEE
jgi:predicted transcriptional regulator